MFCGWCFDALNPSSLSYLHEIKSMTLLAARSKGKQKTPTPPHRLISSAEGHSNYDSNLTYIDLMKNLGRSNQTNLAKPIRAWHLPRDFFDQLISWKNGRREELLFMSNKAVCKPPKPVRVCKLLFS
ncbi:unnamed protein product [Lactuca virosa]|uniref:Uncharacterized protein n=1 Tax=Lactuca virosa TaxID=75947 RepID=A0AAU9PBL7_9ASTR|nr:unnamed protein product [Lactuca virosa]